MNKAKAQVISLMPPTSMEAEQSVLGAILIRPGVFPEVAAILQPQDFYHEAHQHIFQAMLDLHGRGEPLDYVLIFHLLVERSQAAGVGGGSFLVGLADNVGTASNAPYYARQIRSKALMRRTLQTAQEVAGACSDPEADLSDILDFCESQILDIREAGKGNGLRTTEAAILEIASFLETSTPIRATYLDPWLKESSINMITGWRGVGKSGFTMGIIQSISYGDPFGPWEAAAAIPCLYFDAEMTVQDTLERFQGLFYEKPEREKLWIYSDHLSSSLGMPAANLLDEKWRAWLKDEVLLKRGVKLWVLDNIGAVTPGLDENSREAWSPINRWLLDLRFAGISTILIHHEGKGGAQRGTSAREDNLDVSISLKRPKDYHPEEGARFICKFEKARVRQKDLHLIADLEFAQDTDPDGQTVWTYAKPEQENKLLVLEMLDQGAPRKEIARALGITGPRVSQIKAEAVKGGYLTKEGKLTQSGFLYLEEANHG